MSLRWFCQRNKNKRLFIKPSTKNKQQVASLNLSYLTMLQWFNLVWLRSRLHKRLRILIRLWSKLRRPNRFIKESWRMRSRSFNSKWRPWRLPSKMSSNKMARDWMRLMRSLFQLYKNNSYIIILFILFCE